MSAAQTSTYTVIVTPTAASPETTDDISGSDAAILTGLHVHHDGTNDPTVEIFDGTVAAGTSIFKQVFALTDEPTVLFPDVKVAALSVQTTVAAGTMSATVFWKI